MVLPTRGLTFQRMGVSCKLRGSRLVCSSASVLSGPSVRSALIASGHSPTLLARRAMLSVLFRLDRTSRLHLPAPLRSPSITRLHRYYGCSDSCAEARPVGPECSLRRAVPWSPFSCLCRAGLLASRDLSLQSLPSPTTPLPPMAALTPNPSAPWDSRSYG